jgi:hypothetical protein
MATATATATEIGLDLQRPGELGPSRAAKASARVHEVARAQAPHAAVSHDAHGDVSGIVGGSGILLIQACALIPGLLPCLVLAGIFALPLVALALGAGIVVGLPVGLWRLAKRLARAR